MQLYNIEIINGNRVRTTTYYGCLANVESWVDLNIKSSWSAINIILQNVVVRSKIRKVNRWY